MKQLFTLMATLFFCTAVQAQKESDSIRVGNMIIVTKKEKNTSAVLPETAATTDTIPGDKDTLRIGNMVIVRDPSKRNEEKEDRSNYHYNNGGRRRNVSTNWLILDIGFSNFINNTSSYGDGYLYNRTGGAPLGENDFNLNVGKSINVNIWLFMQRLNLIQHHVHLKYGLGIELNNYRYQSSISYLKNNPFVTGVAPAPVIFRDTIQFSKNKLAADYVTVPLMLNYSSNPYNSNKGFSISLGVSAGYLYSQRNKQISDERGKQITSGGIGLEQFKFSYVGEVGLGPVKLYGSYSPSSFYKKQLDMRPYTLGVRFSNW